MYFVSESGCSSLAKFSPCGMTTSYSGQCHHHQCIIICLRGSNNERRGFSYRIRGSPIRLQATFILDGHLS